MSEVQTFAPLAGVRVVEIGDATGQYCGKLLRDFGAEVVKVEPPGGVAARFPALRESADDAAIAASAFAYCNAGKRSVEIDLETAGGQAQLDRLLGAADVLIESLSPAEYNRLGLNLEHFKQRFPGLIVASISGFGRTGPKSGWDWTALTSFASGGLLYLGGMPGRAPVNAPNAQAYHIGSVRAAVAVAAALQAEPGERGCYVDISMQECLAMQEQTISEYLDQGRVFARSGSQHNVIVPGRIYPCADGQVYVGVGAGPTGWNDLLDWLGNPESLAAEEMRNPAFRRKDPAPVDAVVGEFVRHRAKRELAISGQAARVRVMPVYQPGEFVEDPHTQSRGLFHQVSEGRAWLRPPYLFNGQALGSPAEVHSPGADNAAIVREWLGEPRTVPMGPRRRPLHESLDGTRVVEFGFLVAGPLVGRTLSIYGAETIKVETRTRPDTMRRTTHRTFLELNRGKSSLALNMKTAAGRQLMAELLDKSDVLIENMNANVLKSWGLEYDQLIQTNPGLVQIDMQGLGADGPWKDFVTLGASLMAFTGMSWLWSDPDVDPPTGCQLSYPDYVGGLHGAFAILATLYGRKRSGAGKRIELAQFESAAAVTGPAFLQYLEAGIAARPLGNRTPHAPGGIYRAAGTDDWVAIETRNEQEWRRFCEIAGLTDLLDDPRFGSANSRIENRAALDQAIEAWTYTRDKDDISQVLEAAGIPASPVVSGRDLAGDGHLAARGLMSVVRTDDGKEYQVPGNSEVVDGERIPASPEPPTLGKDTRQIMTAILGIDETRFEQLDREGIFN